MLKVVRFSLTWQLLHTTINRYNLRLGNRHVWLAKSDIGSVLQKLWFSVQFRFYKINCSFIFSVQFLHCVPYNVYAGYSSDGIIHLHSYTTALEMMFFRAVLVQPTVT